ncbi:MAG: DUF1349 domain-containing protein [Muribaculaceae bacterium]|nr:DUF1349 domain-containing protein [Muribaculaceae bacterium]
MKKILSAMLLGAAVSFGAAAQTLEKMNWFNEPRQWSISDGRLTMSVTPHSDYWRISHYGFTVDDAPFYYAEYGGEFEAKVKVSVRPLSRCSFPYKLRWLLLCRC